MKAISEKNRESIIIHKKNGEKDKEIAKWLCISIRSISRIWKQYKTTGNCEVKPQNSGRRVLVTEEQMNKVETKIKEVPDITLNDLINEFSLGISVSSLSRRLKKLGYTLKKDIASNCTTKSRCNKKES